MYFTDSRRGYRELKQWRVRKLLVAISFFPLFFCFMIISDIYVNYPVVESNKYWAAVVFLIIAILMMGIHKTVEFKPGMIVNNWKLFTFQFRDVVNNLSDFTKIVIQVKYTPGGEGGSGRKYYDVSIVNKNNENNYDISLHVFLCGKKELKNYKEFIDELSNLTKLPTSYYPEE